MSENGSQTGYNPKELVIGGWSHWSQKLADEVHNRSDLEIDTVYDVRSYEEIENSLGEEDVSMADVGISPDEFVQVKPDVSLDEYFENDAADIFYIANQVKAHEDQVRAANKLVRDEGVVAAEKAYANSFNEYLFDKSHEQERGVTNSLTLHYMFKDPSLQLGKMVENELEDGRKINYIDVELKESAEIVDTEKMSVVDPENGGIARDFLTHGTEVVTMNIGGEIGELLWGKSDILYPELSEDLPSMVEGLWRLEGEEFYQGATTHMEVGKGYDETSKKIRIGFDNNDLEIEMDWENSKLGMGGQPQQWYANSLLQMAENGAEPLIGRKERRKIEEPVDELNFALGVLEDESLETSNKISDEVD